jgi:hypothetical protein
LQNQPRRSLGAKGDICMLKVSRLYLLFATLAGLVLFSSSKPASAQITAQCTNPVCQPGKPCSELRCGDPCAQAVTRDAAHAVSADSCPVTPPSSGTSCFFGFGSVNNVQLGGGALIPDVLIESTDLWTIDEFGNVYYDGSYGFSGTVTSYTPEPNCQQVSDGFVNGGATALADSNIYTTSLSIAGTQFNGGFYAWDHTFYDNGDRSFVFSLDEYPFIFVSPYIVFGIDASNGDLFQMNGNSTQILDDSIDDESGCGDDFC